MVLFLSLEYRPLLSHFVHLVDFISMRLTGWLCFLTLEEWPFMGDVLCVPASHTPMVIRTICFKGALSVGPSTVVG